MPNFEWCSNKRRRWALAWLAFADVLVDRQQYADALRAYRRAQTADPLASRLAKARESLRSGKLADAETGFREEMLENDAGHFGALCGLAAISLECRRRGPELERLLRRALLQSAHAPLIWRLLGQALLETAQLGEADSAIHRSLLVEPRNARSWTVRATINGRLMRPQAALAAYQESERLDPDQRLIHLSIGHVFKTVGRRTECERTYHECIEREPASGEAYWSLADLKNYIFSDSEMAAMEKHLAARTGGDENCALLHFALGRAHEQRDCARRSFCHYDAGNRLRARHSPFDFSGFENKCRRLIGALDREFFAALQGGGCLDAAPIFIVGLPRSGSTLVEQILASHSSVEGTMELPNILHFVREFEHLSANRDAYPEIIKSAPRALLNDLGRRYLRETQPLRTGRPRFIDKLPNNFSHVGLIHAILPNASIIDVRRHPMDACFSCFKQYFSAGQSFTYDLDGLGRYYRSYLEVMDHWDRALPGKVFHLYYENLVRAPEANVRYLLAHCGLEFDERCLQFHETQRAIRTASSEQVRRPLYSSGIGYWRRFEKYLQPLRLSLGNCLERFDGRN